MQKLISETFEQSSTPGKKITSLQKKAILKVIKSLNTGEIRVCNQDASGNWITHEWIKKAILLYFKIQKLEVIKSGDLQFFDKIPLKKWTAKDGVRVVPHALARFGSFVSQGAILMPSYVNIGAFVGEGTLVDTWATVGSCAQIGKRVHISGGVGIGGVLEPIQASPVIIEDDVFLGSRSIIVEGVQVKKGAVIAAGVSLTSSTKIIDVTSSQAKEIRGVVPENSVVIPGSLIKKFPAGEFNVNCALIIGKRTESTDKKTTLNQALREFQVSV
jgi:2,3,4,5-tetrahydropyridine-2-carboxylate N-succinyltransferase